MYKCTLDNDKEFCNPIHADTKFKFPLPCFEFGIELRVHLIEYKRVHNIGPIALETPL